MKYRFLIGKRSKCIILLLFCFLLYSCSQEIENLDFSQEIELGKNFPDFSSHLIEDEYIVVFHDDEITFRVDWENYEHSFLMMENEVNEFFRKHTLNINNLDRVYAFAVQGFSAKIDSKKILEILDDPKVKYIEQDRRGELGVFHIEKKNTEKVSETETDQILPWGVKRVGGPFAYKGRQSVFVLDTGIDYEHPDLNVDLRKGFDAYGGKRREWNVKDEHGHGTHVAGIIGAKDNQFGVVGVAAGVPLVPVKIFKGPRAEYTYSGLLSGIEYVGIRGIPGDVANLSFGGFDESNLLDEAVINVSNKRRVWMVIASGNSNLPANSFSPARVQAPFTITVSAFHSDDRFASFSHYGPPIQFGAPGVNIRSTWTAGRYVNSSGTSMAAPHVSGLRVLGDISTDGFVLNYPLPIPDPIAFRAPIP